VSATRIKPHFWFPINLACATFLSQYPSPTCSAVRTSDRTCPRGRIWFVQGDPKLEEENRRLRQELEELRRSTGQVCVCLELVRNFGAARFGQGRCVAVARPVVMHSEVFAFVQNTGSKCWCCPPAQKSLTALRPAPRMQRFVLSLPPASLSPSSPSQRSADRQRAAADKAAEETELMRVVRKFMQVGGDAASLALRLVAAALNLNSRRRLPSEEASVAFLKPAAL
jgi:hypothetical protein